MLRLLILLGALSLASCYTSPAGPGDDDDASGDDDAVGDDDASGDDDAVGDDDTTSGDDDAVGDDDASGDDDTAPTGPVTCTPGLTQLDLTMGATQTVQLNATAEGASGPEPAVGVVWTVVTGPGQVSAAGLFTSSPDVGGYAEVEAWLDGATDLCVIEMQMEGDQNDSGDPGVPGGFDSVPVEQDDACAAPLLYPLDDSAMPGSFEPPVVQWDGSGFNMHRLELSSEWTSIAVYTAADSYQPGREQWEGLTLFDPGTEVTFQLTSGNWGGGTFNGPVCTSTAPVVVDVTDSSINGTIVYWAPPTTKALSFDATTGSSVDMVDFPPATCHGCHSVNLANPMLMSYGPNMPGTTNLVNLADPSTVLQTWGNPFSPFRGLGAPGPQGLYIVISGSDLPGMGGGLYLYDASSGALLSQLQTAKSATMPNWSPDGTRLTYAGCDGSASIMGAGECSIYQQDWDASNQSFSNEVLLASNTADQTLYYPTYSPDSQWIAFNAAEHTSGADGTITSYANPTAKLMLVSASGGPVMELSSANGVGDLTNSWPRWAPVSGTYGWLAFSSKRAYGHTVSDTPQLWVTGIDLAAAAVGSGDPGRAPTWIPGQLTSEGNHTPTWLPRWQ